ncbi:MAG TPA: isoprenylcysteine carboxylmethyltransferase family protein [Solirubrobacteraceae bacterium]|jgi:protein-S-isoprenylcysteine O-methyltransferase Ste14|nr:isoprenylcysteine carboxylmethyltransferase family protein [Solirubrobacteraceae bacterium]
MRRWLVPGTFLAIAGVTGVHAGHAIAAATAHPSGRLALIALYAVLRATVAFAFAAFTVDRAEPHRRARAPIAFAACAFAMIAVVIVSGPSRETPSGLLVAGDALAVAGCVWLLASVLALGRCFGVLPEARGFVRRGPYRLVRHPVYLGEITAIAGLVLAAPRVWNLGVLALFIAAQILRIHLEERALSLAFPEYRSYAASTSRLVPWPPRTKNMTRAAGAAMKGTP